MPLNIFFLNYSTTWKMHVFNVFKNLQSYICHMQKIIIKEHRTGGLFADLLVELQLMNKHSQILFWLCFSEKCLTNIHTLTLFRTTAVKVGVTVPEKEIWNPRERTPPADIPLQTNQNISENVKNLKSQQCCEKIMD